MNDTIIKVNNLSKKYKVYKNQYTRILEWLTFDNVKLHKEFWALKNINFELRRGESLGIIGPNGAGKSTLLKVLSNALYPTLGDAKVNGRVVSLLELGTGFHQELTGIQNIYNSTSLLGFPPEYVETKLEDIIEFAEIGDFIHQPVKTYSSGMYVRLAFSLYANLDPDIYIVDEALSVGDVFFQQKCYQRLREMKEQGVAIIMVTHDPSPLINFCDYAMIIDKGQIVEIGAPNEVWESYQALQYNRFEKSNKFKISKSEKSIEYGDESVDITFVKMTDINGREKEVFNVGEKGRILIEVCIKKEIKDMNVGIQIKNRLGTVLYGTNTNWQGFTIEVPYVGCKKEICYEIDLNLGVGQYTVTAAVSDDNKFSQQIYNWKENALKFEIIDKKGLTFGGEVWLSTKIIQLN